LNQGPLSTKGKRKKEVVYVGAERSFFIRGCYLKGGFEKNLYQEERGKEYWITWQANWGLPLTEKLLVVGRMHITLY